LRGRLIGLTNRLRYGKPLGDFSMNPTAAFLADRGVVRVEGEDAPDFLQGLLTNDVVGLAAGEARFAALLTPQGKILFDFLVLRAPGAPPVLLLDCPKALAADLAKRLSIYKLRAKVAISDASADFGIVADWSGAADLPAGAHVYADPRAAALGRRAILPRAAAEAFTEAALPAYEAARIAVGAPRGDVDFAYGDAFPHDADMDLFNGVDFAKGCYVGQEVVSRMKHRGEARKRVVRVRLAGAAPAPGTLVTDGALAVGALGAAAGDKALALLRIDRAAEAQAAGRPLAAAGVTVTVEEAPVAL
jgi:tRNA-modifying protein YgfZ